MGLPAGCLQMPLEDQTRSSNLKAESQHMQLCPETRIGSNQLDNSYKTSEAAQAAVRAASVNTAVSSHLSCKPLEQYAKHAATCDANHTSVLLNAYVICMTCGYSLQLQSPPSAKESIDVCHILSVSFSHIPWTTSYCAHHACVHALSCIAEKQSHVYTTKLPIIAVVPRICTKNYDANLDRHCSI